MPKEYYVLTEGRVLYGPGHYDIEGAEATMRQDQKQRPRRSYEIVRIEAAYGPSPDVAPPKFEFGDRVRIAKIGGIVKSVVRAYDYKGAEWAYVLEDDRGVEDQGWREDELEAVVD